MSEKSEKNKKNKKSAEPPAPPAVVTEAAPSDAPAQENQPVAEAPKAGGFQPADGGLPAPGTMIEKVDRNQKVVARCKVLEGNKIQVSKSDPLDPEKDPHIVGSVSKAATVADNVLKKRAWDHDTSLNGHTWWGLKDRKATEGGSTRRASGGKVDTDRDIKKMVESFDEVFGIIEAAIEHAGGDEHRKAVAKAALEQFNRVDVVPEGQAFTLRQNLEYFLNQAQ